MYCNVYAQIDMKNVVKVNADVCVIAIIKYISFMLLLKRGNNKIRKKRVVNLVENVYLFIFWCCCCT